MDVWSCLDFFRRGKVKVDLSSSSGSLVKVKDEDRSARLKDGLFSSDLISLETVFLGRFKDFDRFVLLDEEARISGLAL